MQDETIQPGYCGCGCGARTPLRRSQIAGRPDLKVGEPLAFLRGHNRLKRVRWLPEDRGYETPCHIWQLAKAPNGYGHTTIKGRGMGAHRAAWIAEHGLIPRGLFVCHKCDVRECVNLEHLFLGTPTDNQIDCRDKGRRPIPAGDAHVNALLTWDAVRALRASSETQVALAKRYGVSPTAIYKVQKGLSWDEQAREGIGPREPDPAAGLPKS